MSLIKNSQDILATEVGPKGIATVTFEDGTTTQVDARLMRAVLDGMRYTAKLNNSCLPEVKSFAYLAQQLRRSVATAVAEFGLRLYATDISPEFLFDANPDWSDESIATARTEHSARMTNDPQYAAGAQRLDRYFKARDHQIGETPVATSSATTGSK